MFYNILSTESSFDYNWVNIYHSFNSDNIYEVYENYRKNKLLPNHLVKNENIHSLLNKFNAKRSV